MNDELDRDAFASFVRGEDDGRLELVWLKTSQAMTEDDFRRSLVRLTELAELHRPAHIVIDAVDFTFAMSAQTGTWREQEIIPRYNTAGVRKLAFLLPEPISDWGHPTRETGADFLTAWFDDRMTLESWLAQPEK